MENNIAHMQEHLVEVENRQAIMHDKYLAEKKMNASALQAMSYVMQ